VVGATIQRLSHSATVTSGARGSNRTTIAGFSDQRLDHVGNPHENLVEMERIELSSSRCKREVLPLNDIPTLVPADGIEPPSARLSDASPTGELRWYGGQRENRTRFTALQVLRIASNACRPQISGAKAANRTRVASLPKMHSATELPRLEPRRRIELRSERYECSALPLSYRGNGASDRTRTGVYCMARSNPSHWTTPARKLERNVRIELTSGVWKTPALPLDESRLVAGVGIEPTRAEDYETSLAPCCPHHNIQLSKNWSGTSDSNRESLAPKASGLSHFPSPRK
jgi:hypothetical protein